MVENEFGRKKKRGVGELESENMIIEIFLKKRKGIRQQRGIDFFVIFIVASSVGNVCVKIAQDVQEKILKILMCL